MSDNKDFSERLGAAINDFDNWSNSNYGRDNGGNGDGGGTGDGNNNSSSIQSESSRGYSHSNNFGEEAYNDYRRDD